MQDDFDTTMYRFIRDIDIRHKCCLCPAGGEFGGGAVVCSTGRRLWWQELGHTYNKVFSDTERALSALRHV